MADYNKNTNKDYTKTKTSNKRFPVNSKKVTSKYSDNNKNTPKKARPYVKPTEIRAGGEIEYKMAPGLYDNLVREAKKNQAGDIQAYLCQYVNEQFGLLGVCVNVIVG